MRCARPCALGHLRLDLLHLSAGRAAHLHAAAASGEQGTMHAESICILRSIMPAPAASTLPRHCAARPRAVHAPSGVRTRSPAHASVSMRCASSGEQLCRCPARPVSSPRTCPMALNAPCSTSTSACSTHAFSSKGICTVRMRRRQQRTRAGARVGEALTPGGRHTLRQRFVRARMRRIVQQDDEGELLASTAARARGERQRRKHWLDPHKDGAVCDGQRHARA